MRNLPNVVIAKDHNSSALDDLALVQMSKAHMGASSGPNAINIFGTKPFVTFNYTRVLDRSPWSSYKKGRGKMPWWTERQSALLERETSRLLNQEFEILFT
jgi:hypothetical protein